MLESHVHDAGGTRAVIRGTAAVRYARDQGGTEDLRVEEQTYTVPRLPSRSVASTGRRQKNARRRAHGQSIRR